MCHLRGHKSSDSAHRQPPKTSLDKLPLFAVRPTVVAPYLCFRSLQQHCGWIMVFRAYTTSATQNTCI